ncbi:MAG: glutamate acetyltransferase [Cyanobacteria bacterium P01_A01_bin.45]
MVIISVNVYNIALSSKYIAVIKLISSSLREAINYEISSQKYTYLIEKYIHLHQGRDSSRIVYVSDIVLKLLKSQNLQDIKTAEAIASYLETNKSEILTVKVVPPGLLYLEPSDLTIASCLQNLVEISFVQLGGKKNTNEIVDETRNKMLDVGSLFAVQYAHARCYSLIELAHQQNLFSWVQQETHQEGSSPQLIAPSPFPWLRKDGYQKLHFYLSGELLLVKKLVEVSDRLELGATRNWRDWQKLALSVSHAFDTFWAQCPLLGEVKINCIELAQARCGLVIVTQLLLKRLLEEKLRIYAPVKI